MGTENDAANSRDGSFADIKLLLDEERTQHEQARETTEDHVRQMRLIDIQVVPRHGERRDSRVACTRFL